MFLLSKLLPLLLLPLGLALLLLVWGLLRRRRWPAGAALAILWIFATPLTAEGLWRWLERPQQRRVFRLPSGRAPVAVVVLGGGRHPAPGPDRLSEWHDGDRFFGGLEAYRQLRAAGRPARLIFTGGWWPLQPSLPPEGETLRRHALALGLSAADLITTGRVSNTADEALAVAGLLPRGSRVVLVTSAFHMPRARRLFERQGLQVVPYPVDFQASATWAGNPLANPLAYVPSAAGLDSSSRALREALGRTLYRAW
jgi:uncharacterized SAM-binding protein YcdF (DUF218 family)